MIQIIHILGDANLSGAPMHVMRLAKGLDHARFRSFVVCPNGPIADELTWANIPYSIIPMANKFDLRALFAIRRVIAEQKKKAKASSLIIHCHGVRAGFLGRLAAKDLPYPLIYTEHLWTADYHLPHKLNETIQLALLRYLDRYTSVTVGVSQSVVDFLLQAEITTKEKIVKIYNAVSVSTKPGFIAGTTPPVIGSVGSLTWQKNYGYLIELFAEVRKSLPLVRLEIIGEGDQRAKLEGLISRYSLEDAVTLHGAPPHEAIAPVQRHWTLYIQSSVNESFGLALTEAIALGLPALSSRVGATSEVLGTEKALFDLSQKEETVKKIVELLKNKEKRRELHVAELEQVRRFSPTKMIAGHEALYTSLIQS